MNSVEQQDAQRIALVATLATRLYCEVLRAAVTNGLRPGKTIPTATSSISDAFSIVNAVEARVRTPTGDA